MFRLNMTPEDKIVENYQEIARIKAKWENIHMAYLENDVRTLGVTFEKAVYTQAFYAQEQKSIIAAGLLSNNIHWHKQDYPYTPRSEYAKRKKEIEKVLLVERAIDSNNIFDLMYALYEYPDQAETLMPLIEDIWARMPQPAHEELGNISYVTVLLHDCRLWTDTPFPKQHKVFSDIEWSIKEIERSKRAMNKLPKKDNE